MQPSRASFRAVPESDADTRASILRGATMGSGHAGVRTQSAVPGMDPKLQDLPETGDLGPAELPLEAWLR